MRLRLVLLLAVVCGLASAAGAYLVIRYARPQRLHARVLNAVDEEGELHVVVEPAPPPHIQRVQTCQFNTRAINVAVQAYFAQNKQWPDEVSDMLPNTANFASTTPAGLTGGQLTEMPICPFGAPYQLAAVHEDPADTSTPIVGYLTDWKGHWPTYRWQDATEHLP
jgi:hypothetical protein